MKVLLSPLIFLLRLLWQTVFLALGQVWANKVRAVLTALGIIIGVVGVTVIAAGLQGMQGYVLNEFEGLGASKMWLNGNVPQSKRSVMSWTDVKMTTYEARLLRDNADSLSAVTPESGARWDVSYGKKVAQSVRVTGIWPSWHDIENRQVLYGRPLSNIDDSENRQVCIINERAIEELNLDVDPVGDYLLVDGRRFLIVGVVETKEATMFEGGDSRVELYIPFSTHKMMNPYTWTSLILQLKDPDKASDAQEEIRFILRNHRNLAPDDEDTFEMFAVQSIIDGFNNVAWVIRVVMLVVVAISLLVGGIGIMNIMLVSVSERTREIGLRKAMGAKPPVVLMQFLVEAVVLCFVGGLVGLLIGQLITVAVTFVPDLPLNDLAIPGWAIWISLLFSGGVGILFGMFPAIKASMLNPINALRHE